MSRKKEEKAVYEIVIEEIDEETLKKLERILKELEEEEEE